MKLWNTETLSEIGTLAEHKGSVNALAFSEDSKYLASCSYDSLIKLWDVNRQFKLITLVGHSSWVTSV